MRCLHKSTCAYFCKLLTAFLVLFSAAISFFPGTGCGDPVSAPPSSSIAIPKELGTVKEIHEGASEKLVLHIQDAHASPSAQLNIARLLGYLQKTYGLSLAGSEGAEGPLDFTLYRALPFAKLKREVLAADLKKSGTGGGVEFFGILSPEEMQLVGVDNQELYRKNIKQYAALLSRRDEYLATLRVVQKAVENLKPFIWSKDQIAFERAVSGFHKKTFGSLFYLERLIRLKKTRRLKTPEARFLSQVHNFLVLAEPAFRAELTPSQLKKIRRLHAGLNAQKLFVFIKKFSNRHHVKLTDDLLPRIEQTYAQLAEVFDFYDTVHARDVFLAQGISRAMEAAGVSFSAIVAGGFHTKGLIGKLREKQFGCLVIQPVLGNVQDVSFTQYEQQMAGLGFALAGVRPLMRYAVPFIMENPSEGLRVLRDNTHYVGAHFFEPYVRQAQRMRSGFNFSALSYAVQKNSDGRVFISSDSATSDVAMISLGSFKNVLRASDRLNVSPAPFIDAQAVTLQLPGRRAAQGFGSKDNENHLVQTAALEIRSAYHKYAAHFEKIIKRAEERFLQQDWSGRRADEHERLTLYIQAVDELAARLKDEAGEKVYNIDFWNRVKEHYRSIVAGGASHPDLVYAFFIAAKSWFIPMDMDDIRDVTNVLSVPLSNKIPEIAVYTMRDSTEESLRHAVSAALANVAQRIPHLETKDSRENILNAIKEHFTSRAPGRKPESIEIIKPLFYRGESAYVVARILSDGNMVTPLILELQHGKTGIEIKKILLRHSDAARIFSQTQSHFHVAIDNHLEVTAFLNSFMEWKNNYTLFRLLGYNNLAKVLLLNDLYSHIHGGAKFSFAAGMRGTVMHVINLSGADSDVVIKMVKDRFDPPKTGYKRKQILDRYRFVRYVDREDALVDVQNLYNVRFPISAFDPQVLDTLSDNAAQSVEIAGDSVVFKQFYVERKAIPLDLLRDKDPVKIRAVISEYLGAPVPDKSVSDQELLELRRKAFLAIGQVVKNMAEKINTFFLDLRVPNFGLIAPLTPNMRVILFDYDDLALLTDVSFLQPRVLADDDDLDYVMGYDQEEVDQAGAIVPQNLKLWLWLPEDLKDEFEQVHGDLFTRSYYKQWQSVHTARPDTHINAFPFSILQGDLLPEIVREYHGFGAGYGFPVQAAGYFHERFQVGAELGFDSTSRAFMIDTLSRLPRAELEAEFAETYETLREVLTGHFWIFSGPSSKEFVDRLVTLGDRTFLDFVKMLDPHLLIMGEDASIIPDVFKAEIKPENIHVLSTNSSTEQLRYQLGEIGFYGAPLTFFANPSEIPENFLQALSPGQTVNFESAFVTFEAAVKNYLLLQEAVGRSA